MSLLLMMSASGGGGVITYATWNPDDMGPNLQLSAGDLRVDAINATTWRSIRANIGHSSGKHYFELDNFTGLYHISGIATASAALSSYFTDSAHGAGYYRAVNEFMLNNAQTPTGLGVYAQPFGVLVDLDAKELRLQFPGPVVVTDPLDLTPMLGGSPLVYPAVALYQSGENCTANFGASPFTMPVPVGYRAGWYTP